MYLFIVIIHRFVLWGFFGQKGNPVTKESSCIVLFLMHFLKKLYLYWRLIYFKTSNSQGKERSFKYFKTG